MKLKTLTAKEFLSFFYNPLGFVFLVIFLLVANFLYFNNFFLYNSASLRTYFESLSLMMVFLVPALSMRSFSEEKKSGTEELLYTWPVTDWQIIISKFLANLIFLGLVLLLTISVPITVAGIGNLDLGPVITGYLGMLFLGGLYFAIGLYLSSHSSQQITVFLLTIFTVFVLFLSGQPMVLERTGGAVADVLQFLSPISHFENFVKGLVDVRDVLYFSTFAFFFLFLLYKKLTLRRHE